MNEMALEGQSVPVTLKETEDEGSTESFYNLDKEVLMEKMASRLPQICGELDLTITRFVWRTGFDKERIGQIVSGKRRMKWSEYMSILFVLWDDEKGRESVEKWGLFPDALKEAMSVNHNAHGERA